MDVVGWLRSLGLERYEAVFRENEITQRVLPNLTAEDLKETRRRGFRASPYPTRCHSGAARGYGRQGALR